MRTAPARSRRVALTLTLAAVAAGPVAGALAQDAGPAKTPLPDYATMIVKTTKSKQSTQAKLGSYCGPTTDGTGECKYITPPLPDLPKVTVSKGEKLKLLFKKPVTYVNFRTARVVGGKEVLIAGGEGSALTSAKRTWQVTLPKNLTKKATIIGFTVQYVNVFAAFEIGINVK